jgi:hypothetical protein
MAAWSASTARRDALARARLRAEQRGLTQVQFVEGDIHDPAPGGLVVPVEVDLSPMRWLPEIPLGTPVKSWLVEGFAKAGLTMLGPRLWAILQEAGLRPLGMIGVQPHFGPDDPVGIAFLVENVRVAAPLIVGTGVATAEELGMETFEQRLRDEGEGPKR